MNPQVTDELISAYFDGEVSPEERAAVERLLASSEDAQRELNETARLSALLHSFPRESAPVELVENVLRQTNQLPLPAQVAPKIAAASTRQVWREWMAGLAGVAVTAAAGLLVMAFNVDPVRGPAESPVASNDVRLLEKAAAPEAPMPMAAKSAEPAVAMDDRTLLRNEKDAKRVSGAAAEGVAESADKPTASQVPLPAPAPPSNLAARSRSMMMQRKASEPAAEIASDAAPARGAFGPALNSLAMDAQQIDASELGQTGQDFLQGLREGNIYTLTPQPADPDSNVAVVTFQVLDIDKSAELMQVLLKKNSINPRTVNKDGTATPNDLVVLYVVAPGEKLAKTLEDVELHRDLLPKVVVDPPLQFASLSDEAKQQAEKKEESIQAKSANAGNKEKQANKPDAAADDDMPEFKVVLDAYNARNGMANSAYGNSIASTNGQLGGNRDGIETLQRQQAGNSVREKSKSDVNVRGLNPAMNQAQGGQIGRAGSGYDYARFNNSVVTNTAPGGMANNSVTPLNQATPAQNPFRLEQNNTRRQLASSNQDRALNNDSNRALRMLFVLHPQADGTQPPPAAAVPTKPQ